jgi:hypothetical protein
VSGHREWRMRQGDRGADVRNGPQAADFRRFRPPLDLACDRSPGPLEAMESDVIRFRDPVSPEWISQPSLRYFRSILITATTVATPAANSNVDGVSFILFS